jgi:hypothetical protein
MINPQVLAEEVENPLTGNIPAWKRNIDLIRPARPALQAMLLQLSCGYENSDV